MSRHPTRKDQDGRHHIVALAEMKPYPWIPLHYRDFEFNAVRLLQRRDFFHWEKRLDAASLPSGDTQVFAWALDAENMRAYRVAGSHSVEGSGAPALATLR